MYERNWAQEPIEERDGLKTLVCYVLILPASYVIFS